MEELSDEIEEIVNLKESKQVEPESELKSKVIFAISKFQQCAEHVYMESSRASSENYVEEYVGHTYAKNLAVILPVLQKIVQIVQGIYWRHPALHVYLVSLALMHWPDFCAHFRSYSLRGILKKILN